jgi:RHS repeat-associated protein
MATTKYCYDGTDLIYEKDDDGGYREYYHGPEGLLSMYDSSGGGSRRYHFYDGMGSTSELTNESGTELGTYTYDAWGSQLSGPALTNPFRYIGKHGYYSAAADGMSLLQQRYYRPSVGRFWTRVHANGIKGGEPAYGYASNNPAAYVDPLGLAPGGTTPDCCANNRPGKKIRAGKCEVVRVDPKDPRYWCWMDRCRVCDTGDLNQGLDEQYMNLEYLLFSLQTPWGGSPRLCYKISACTGVCAEPEAGRLGCDHGGRAQVGRISTRAAHGIAPHFGLACCMQSRIDFCCAFAPAREFSLGDACRPQGCKKDGKSGIPDLSGRAPGPGFPKRPKDVADCLRRVVHPAGGLLPWPFDLDATRLV